MKARCVCKLERAKDFLEYTNQPFCCGACCYSSKETLHNDTPVAAGFDYFAPALVEKYLGWYAQKQLKYQLMICSHLGEKNPNDPLSILI